MGYKPRDDNGFYNGNPLVKAAGAKHEFTLDEIQQLKNCINDPAYFINNFVKITSIDKGVVLFKLHPYQKRIIDTINQNRFTICKLFRQAGKALPLETPIATPDGFKPICDIHPGDTVFGDDGLPTRVTAESDVQLLDMYQITFDTGETITACKDHQWTVRDRRNKHRNCEITLTTEQLAQNKIQFINRRGYPEYRYYIPNTKPVQYQSKQVNIDPYILGVWLGDGNSRDNRFTFEECNLQFFKDQGITPMITEGQTRLGSKGQNIYMARIKELHMQDLRNYNLISNKHIPNDYLLGSVDQRIALLQGLVDTDGYINDRHMCEIAFSAKYEKLCDDTLQLIHSLGIKVTKKYKKGTNSFSLYFYADGTKFDVCRLSYKKANINYCQTKLHRYTSSRTIINVQKLPDKKLAKCITVDNERHMYLCGTNYLPTHNSTVVAAYCLWYAIFNSNKEVMILANKLNTAKEIFSRVASMYELLPDFIKPGVKEYNKTSMTFENGSKVGCQATSASAIRGKSINK